MIKVTKFIIVLLGVLLLNACAHKKDLIYFQFDEIDQEKVTNNYQLTFKSDDLVQIIVSTKDLISAQPFNLPIATTSPTAISAQGNPILQSYLIDVNGEIEFPVLGKIKLGGLTRVQAIEMLKKKLSPAYLTDPVINILITNFKITVIGDVTTPKLITVQNERISILDALGMVGDLSISGNRKNVMVIREENNMKKKYTIDLTSNACITSPVYYLQQNDVVYIEQNNAKVQDAAYTRTTGLFISLASVFISLLTILTR
jgi:polysaccharide export outer membrane protein